MESRYRLTLKASWFYQKLRKGKGYATLITFRTAACSPCCLVSSTGADPRDDWSILDGARGVHPGSRLSGAADGDGGCEYYRLNQGNGPGARPADV